MRKINWKPAQRRAIETIGRNVLVTASAGTGKTAVLSERCVLRICDGERPIDVEQVLVLTFTDSAAEEMKGRIAKKLYEVYLQNPGDAHLRKQMVRLDAAAIGTIHSFCKRILTEHFYLAGLGPRFGILDEDQQKLVRARAVTAAIEAAWNDPALTGGMQALFEGRVAGGRQTFADALLRLAGFLDSVSDRNAFYESATRLAADSPESYDILAQFQFEHLRRRLYLCRDMLIYARSLDNTLAAGQYLTAYIEEILASLESCLEAIRRDDLDTTAEMIRQWEFSRMPSLSKKLEIDKEDAERIKELVDWARKKIRALKELVLFEPEYLRLVAPLADAQTRTLISLLRVFDGEYAAAKRAMGVLDFADLEHKTLELFKMHPAVAEKLCQRFAYVFVDEYQDINDVQQRILEAVSRGDNVFVVGDVKQSIYAFRQSRPEIFLQRLSAATDKPKSAGEAMRVDMNDNFRSRREILAFVNRVFGRIMTQSVAGVDYFGRAELEAGLDYPPLKGDTPIDRKAVEFYLLDEQSPEYEDSADESEEADENEMVPFNHFATAVQRQAAFIAQRIRRMVGAASGRAEFEVMDKYTGQMRPVEYRDIVILMRATSGRAPQYVELLRLAGIPVSSQSPCGYFAATEVTDFLALLRVLDNPLQDIELAAVLRSVLFRFTDSELAAVRFFADGSGDNKCAFYEIAWRYGENGPDVKLRQKTDETLRMLQAWRVEARRKPLSELIWRILEERNFLAFVSALPNGPQRRANLLKLHGRAVQFESFTAAGEGNNLAAFVAFLEKLLEEESDWAAAQPQTGVENAVRIMSVHKSKGLEFPVVFAAELNRPFRNTDGGGACEIDSRMLGLEVPDRRHGVRLTSPAHQLIRQSARQSAIAEEMRILYVAMTRARDRLILTASREARDCRKILSRLPRLEIVPDWILLDAASHLDWVLAALAGSDAVGQMVDSDTQEVFEDDLFVASRIGKDQLNVLTAEMLNRKGRRGKTYEPVTAGSDEPEARRLFEQIRNAQQWRYPYEGLTGLNAKFSVSALTHRDDEFARTAIEFSFTETKSSSDNGDALALGSAAHLVFQHLPLAKAMDETVIRETIAGLLAQNQISAGQVEKIDIAAIASFFRTDMGRRVLEHSGEVLREWPFTMALPVSKLGIDRPGESVVVQGIVDLIIPAEEGLILVDFKTDRISSEGVARRAEQYQSQLALYACAAGTILKKPIVAAYLYFLHPRTLYPVPFHQIALTNI
ncbi:MAG: helicase-exonuclease AddAB subunit AddA [Planctomycetes bacterium]|nr:helicase-exonuclease AddAB subunit AddA [Planctomycetota bacterium]